MESWFAGDEYWRKRCFSLVEEDISARWTTKSEEVAVLYSSGEGIKERGDGVSLSPYEEGDVPGEIRLGTMIYF